MNCSRRLLLGYTVLRAPRTLPQVSLFVTGPAAAAVISKSFSTRNMSSSATPLTFTPTCDLFDTFEHTARVPVVSWRNLGGVKQFCGRAVTVKCFEDNSRIKELVQTPGENQVLVVDGGASMRHALMGDFLADLAAKNDWAGVIVYGCIRDVDALGKIPLGVQALGTTPRKSVRRGEGKVGLTIRIGDVKVHPGDYVYADNDGVLIIDPTEVENKQEGT